MFFKDPLSSCFPYALLTCFDITISWACDKGEERKGMDGGLGKYYGCRAYVFPWRI